MKLPCRLVLYAAMSVVLALGPYCAAHAETASGGAYPNRPIRMISPYEPGGGVDIMARMVAQNLTRELGVSVVVENRPGAGGVVGTQSLTTAPPDGYTLILDSPSPLVVAPYLMKKLNYDPQQDLEPVSLIADVPAVLLVKNDSPIHSVKDLLDLARKEPGKLTFSSSGLGGTAHLSAQLLKVLSGADMLHVPYKGTAPAIQAVMTGEVTMTFADMTAGLAFVKNHQLRAVAVTTPQRNPALPDVPTVAETVPGYASSVWYGVLAPKGTPRPVIDKLNREIVKFVHAPAVHKMLVDEGADPIGSTPEQFRDFIRAESQRWGDVIRKSGIQPQ
ncbi:Bug family tripartite tricarboxylate transporter substrate binding protein [Bordetella genomosp. 8]|nr:tripartite tricarboxylate transporter substrate binding protein [Bordetella genomosp. 8]